MLSLSSSALAHEVASWRLLQTTVYGVRAYANEGTGTASTVIMRSLPFRVARSD